MSSDRLGVVVRGSLSKGLELKLDPEVSLEALRAGMFAIASGRQYDFFSLMTDLELSASTEEALDGPIPAAGSLLREVLAGEGLYARATLRPHLMLDRLETDPTQRLLPVKTIPGHFTEVRRATRQDVDGVFGNENTSSGHFRIGTPVDMDGIDVCLDLERFSERSNGIFGKSGTGKTFLTRLVLAGLVSRGKAVNLVFDMHSEYGLRGTDESRPGQGTRGLRELFGPNRVQVYSLDPQQATSTDGLIKIPYSYLEPEDILGLQRILGLTPTAAENTYLLHRRFREKWFAETLSMDAEALAEEEGAHAGSLSALRRKLARLERECEAFLRPDAEVRSERERGPVERILDNLERGIHTVIQFGRFDQLIHYLLVANLLTRRIDERWRAKTSAYLADRTRAKEPQRLVITIEEAHKFLEPGVGEHTTFGRIARELRKYNVTLLVVDQRPSQIEREVMSQLGTKICCLLDDESDVDAVLSGASGGAGLRGVLSSLDTRQQALIFGHALPMPVVVRTRTYDETFWQEMGYAPEEARVAATRARMSEDFPDD
jgi:DNA helicase HerA-like ATPase